MANITWALQFPHRLDGKEVSGLEGELGDMGVSVAGVYQVSDVPGWMPNKEDFGPYIYTASGIESIFWGNPSECFDFEARLRYVFGNAIISSGTKHDTGEQLWIARSCYFFPETDQEIRKGMDKETNTDTG